MALIKGIGGVFFKSPNKDTLLEWYKTVFELEVEDYGGCSFNTAADEVPYTVWSIFRDDTDYFAPSGQACMINFVVEDIAVVLERVEQAGGRVVGDIQKESYGDFAWFLDPDGNKVELWRPRSE